MPRCQKCGNKNQSELGWENNYVGGQGYVRGLYCLDQIACWYRWDEQHGLEPGGNIEHTILPFVDGRLDYLVHGI